MRKKIIFNRRLILQNPSRKEKALIEPNEAYLFNTDQLSLFRRMYNFSIKEVEDMNWITPTPLREAKNILIYRVGGIGDILFLFPYLSSIKKINPNCKISFICGLEIISILDICPHIDVKIPEPVKYDDIIKANYDKIIVCERFIEENPESEYIHAMDLPKDTFLEGIERGPIESTFSLSDPIGDKIHIAIAYSCSALIREISPSIWFDFIRQLEYDKFRVTLVAPVDKFQDIEDVSEEIRKHNPKLELRRLCNESLLEVIKTTLNFDRPHIAIGADSGLVNLWGYHGIPVIGLYGPFESKLRLKYYKNAIGIDAITNCLFGKNENGSCFVHSTKSCDLAQYKEELHSPCLHLINADHIRHAVNYFTKLLYTNQV